MQFKIIRLDCLCAVINQKRLLLLLSYKLILDQQLKHINMKNPENIMFKDDNNNT